MSDGTTLLTYARLSSDVYNTHGCLTDGWARIHEVGSRTGFFAAIYKKGNSYVLAFRGTDQKLDFATGNIMNLIHGQSFQAEQALAYCNALAERAKNAKVFLTGHSLGGALVTMTVLGRFGFGNSNVAGAATFCAPGVSLPTMISKMWRSMNDYPVANILVNKDLVSNIPGNVVGKNSWIDVAPAKLTRGEKRSRSDVGSEKSWIAKVSSNHGIDQVITALEGPERAIGGMTVMQATGTFRNPMDAYFSSSR